MANKLNRWDFWDCPAEVRDECPIYTLNPGKDCFNLATGFYLRLKLEFQHCWECPWYKTVNQDLKQKRN